MSTIVVRVEDCTQQLSGKYGSKKLLEAHLTGDMATMREVSKMLRRKFKKNKAFAVLVTLESPAVTIVSNDIAFREK